jgi:hypothetical protein
LELLGAEEGAPLSQASKPLFVGARLAGEGALKDAFVGKPGSYMSDFALN